MENISKQSSEARSEDVSPGASYTIRSLLVGLNVLEAIAQSGRDRGVSELAKELKLTKFQIFRHLHTLCDAGFLSQNSDTERFSLGGRAYDLLQSIQIGDGLVQRARRIMARLRDERGHTVTLARLVDDRRITIIESEGGREAVQYVLKVGASFDLHSSAHGKVALAFGPPHLLEKIIAGGLPQHTGFTLTDPDALRREIARIRAQGWASASQETIRGMNTLAAPIMSRRGYEGSIGMFAPVEILPPEPDPADVGALLTAARDIPRDL